LELCKYKHLVQSVEESDILIRKFVKLVNESAWNNPNKQLISKSQLVSNHESISNILEWVIMDHMEDDLEIYLSK
jgi:hypothetical protein